MWTSHTINGTEVAKCDQCGANGHRSLIGTEEPCVGRCARTVRPIIETTHTINPTLKRDHNGNYRLNLQKINPEIFTLGVDMRKPLRHT